MYRESKNCNSSEAITKSVIAFTKITKSVALNDPLIPHWKRNKEKENTAARYPEDDIEMRKMAYMKMVRKL